MLESLSAAGFIRCGVTGVPMPEDDAMVDVIDEDLIEDDLPVPSEDLLDSAERIIERLNPPSRTAIAEMIHTKAKIVGGIFAGYAVFWWLTVLQVKDEPEFESIFFGPDFLAITILAPVLIFTGSLLSDISRERGQLFSGLVSGIMFVLSILYTFEPAILGFLGDITTSDAIWKTTRLAILNTTVLFAAKLLIDAWLLAFVKKLMENYPNLELAGSSGESNLVSELGSDTEA
jgi:hypothetical protein